MLQTRVSWEGKEGGRKKGENRLTLMEMGEGGRETWRIVVERERREREREKVRKDRERGREWSVSERESERERERDREREIVEG